MWHFYDTKCGILSGILNDTKYGILNDTKYGILHGAKCGILSGDD